MSEIPDWLRTYMDRCSEALGLGHLTLGYRVRSLGKPLWGGGGKAKTYWRYNRATLTFDSDITDDAVGYETVTHECAHVALMPLHRSAARIVDLVPKAHRKHAWALWQDGEEEAVTRLAAALAPVLRPTSPTDIPPAGDMA